MNRLFLLPAVILCLLSGGCATGRWAFPPNMTREDAMKEAYNCNFMANMQAKGYGTVSGLVAEQEFGNCLRSRGFTWIPDQKQK